MTQEAELTQRERDLTAMVLDLQAELEALREEINRWKFNGAEDMFGGGGFQRFSGGRIRMDSLAIQALAQGVDLNSLIFVKEFLPSDTTLPSTEAFPYAYVTGLAESSVTQATYITTGARSNVDDRAISTMEVDPTNEFSNVTLLARRNNNVVQLEVRSDSSQEHIALTHPLYLNTGTSDPVSPSDGYMWYRADLDEFRVRINGATRVLSHTAP